MVEDGLVCASFTINLPLSVSFHSPARSDIMALTAFVRLGAELTLVLIRALDLSRTGPICLFELCDALREGSAELQLSFPESSEALPEILRRGDGAISGLSLAALPRGKQEIVSAVPPSCRCLGLSCCGLGDLDCADSVIRFAETVDLSFNQLSAKGAALISTALSLSRTIISLNLSHNNIGPDGARTLAIAL